MGHPLPASPGAASPGDPQRVLVTGGCGYIGSHTCLQLLAAGVDVTVLDNLCNSSPEALVRVGELAGRPARFIEADVRDAAALEALFAESGFDAVVHFAGLKAVGESVRQPLRYFQNNVAGTLCLLEAMQRAQCHTLVFSSTATVYGDPETVPVREDMRCGDTASAYARSKWLVEQILADLAVSGPPWRLASLRYFNPVGAHPSGRIGEDPLGVPNNLMPYMTQVACGLRERLAVFGNDYPTPDGTGVRDYLHVMDLADGHLAALRHLMAQAGPYHLTLNLGTGRGHSVLEVHAAFEQASGRRVPYEVVARRPGDVASYYADCSKAEAVLGWKARFGIEQMCADSWRWQAANPRGYAG